jgi:hypothetical protein
MAHPRDLGEGVVESPEGVHNPLTRLAQHAYVLLLHHPVYDKNRRVVATAITNLDIHDIARASRTFGLGGFYLATPIAAQRELGRRIVGHWKDGFGARYNERRKEALETVRIVSDLSEAREAVRSETGQEPLVCVTAARTHSGLTESELLEEVERLERPLLLCFGTGWGLTDEVLAGADRVLRAIRGAGEYNHLSVRAAVAIILDRLFGERLVTVRREQ